MKKVIGILFGLYLLYLGIDVYNTGKYDAYYGYEVNLNNFKDFVSIVFIFLGLFVVYKTMKMDMQNDTNNNVEFSKCPKCKTSYNYSDLKDGICPKCNIKTIEMEEYYKKYPEELEDI